MILLSPDKRITWETGCFQDSKIRVGQYSSSRQARNTQISQLSSGLQDSRIRGGRCKSSQTAVWDIRCRIFHGKELMEDH